MTSECVTSGCAASECAASECAASECVTSECVCSFCRSPSLTLLLVGVRPNLRYVLSVYASGRLCSLCVTVCVVCWQRSSSATADVQEALEQFAKSGKLPPKVLEASIIRKPYFVRRFLPALLTPTPVRSNC